MLLCAWLGCLVVVPSSWGESTALTGQELITVSGGTLEVGCDTDRGAIGRLADSQLPFDVIDRQAGTVELWEIELQIGGQAKTVTPKDAPAFRWERIADPSPGLKLRWEGFAPELQVSAVDATVMLDQAESVTRWEIAVTKAADVLLERVRYPRVGGIRRQDREALAVPAWMGQLRLEPRKALVNDKGESRRLEWSYPGGLSLQCAAWYSAGGPGMYVACNDSQARRKSLAFWGSTGEAANLEWTHEPEGRGQGRGEYRLPYQVVLGAFVGDWFTAAERYRVWGREQTCSRESRLRNGLVPDWVVNTGAWVWNRGRSEGVLPPASRFQQHLDLPVSVFWHWWHGCAYDVGFPEYFPPREGTESFVAALDAAHHSQVRAMVYMNQRLWGMSTRSWTDENAAQFAVKTPDGSIRPEIYNVFDRQPCAAMCLGTSFWRDKYAGLAEQAVKLGVDAIYMDQACLSLACYDTHHGHPPGGGNFWIAGFRQLAEDIRRRVGNTRPLALAGEGCGEPWLNSLDLMLSLQVSQERYSAPSDGWEVIPFFHAVYHADAVLFGSYSSLSMPPYDELWPAEFAPEERLTLLDRRFSRQFYLEQARAFVWGQQPTVANFLDKQLQERAAEVNYVKRIAQVRAATLQYLLRGTMLRPPRVDVAQSTLDFSRVSIYAGRRGGQTVFQKPAPLVLSAAWRAPDGQLGVALASIADEKQSVRIELSPREHGLRDQSQVFGLSDSGREALARVSASDPHLDLEVPPLAVWFLEFE
jgi:hypothetical protein